MSYQITKDEIIVSGWENGIAQSPHKGIANIQAGNISTEGSEIMANFDRQSQGLPTGSTVMSLSYDTATSLATNISIPAGIWITVTSSSHPAELPNATYYVRLSQNSKIEVTSVFGGSSISGFTSGITASFIFNKTLGKPLDSAIENYFDGTNFQTRYYIIDNNGLMWVKDTAVTDAGVNWFLPDRSVVSSIQSISVFNGWVFVFSETGISIKSTSVLGKSIVSGNPGWTGFFDQVPLSASSAPHISFVGHQGKLYYTDGNFLGSIFPNTSLLTSANNIQSYGKFTASGTTCTYSAILGGSAPRLVGGIRVPAFFFSPGTKPTAITTGTQYWIKASLTTPTEFEVYDASTGGNLLNMQTGAVGDQYFNTFYPIGTFGRDTCTFTPQRLNLPFSEIAQCMGEIGNTLVIGCKSNILYPWNQVDITPGDLIPLPEINSVNMVTVNNMLYVFAGNKGNIYVTNGSTASLVLSVPDYCAGLDGTPSSYVEPYFTWGDAMYLRGRVWFSIQDQTSTKTGNCGGIWSFVPSQNFYYGQDTGLSLRIENRSSYGTYNGYSPVLIPIQTQTVKSPQYYNAWVSDVTTPTYGIDATGTQVTTPCVVEIDLIPTGTMLEKKTFSQVEYKLSAPLTTGESVAISYRQDSTSAFVSCGTLTPDSSGMSGYYPVNFEKGQWLQLRVTLTPNGNTGSFVRLRQILIR